jgi:enoyl-CoA hydratase/carnithine racemase
MSVVDYRRDAAVAHLVLNNPGKLNVLNPQMLAGIGAALDAFLDDEQARVLIVRGEGTSFSAGVESCPSTSFIGISTRIETEDLR